MAARDPNAQILPASQLERTAKLLDAWDFAERSLANAIRCPECRSLRVAYPQFARNSVLTNVAAGIAAELGLVEKDYYCEQCHYTWPKNGSDPIRNRAHMAPYYFIEDVQSPACLTKVQREPWANSSHEAA